MIIPNIWENKKWQPNHQPVIHFYYSLIQFTTPANLWQATSDQVRTFWGNPAPEPKHYSKHLPCTIVDHEQSWAIITRISQYIPYSYISHDKYLISFFTLLKIFMISLNIPVSLDMNLPWPCSGRHQLLAWSSGVDTPEPASDSLGFDQQQEDGEIQDDAMGIWVYIYIHIYIYIHTYMCIYIYIHTICN